MAKRPSVLSFQRCLNITDGVMFSVINPTDADKSGASKLEHIPVIRHGIRGINGTSDAANKTDKEGVTNIQITESAKTSHDAEGLSVKFALKPLDLNSALFSSNDPLYKDGVSSFVNAVIGSESLAELSRRYARNVLNGRWLWRNRVISQNLAVSVNWAKGAEVVNSTGFGRMKDFNAYSPEEIKLGKAIEQVLSGESSTAFNIEGRILFDFKGAMEVYPSQNFTNDKPKGFARPLYKIDPISALDLKDLMKSSPNDFADTIKMGKAGIRDEKIGNALRTVDTWYNEGRVDSDPIAIEPNGANLDAAVFFRKTNGVFGLLDNMSGMADKARSLKEVADPEIMFLIAVMIRGGVYGESKKDDAPKAAKGKAAKAVATESLAESD